VFASIESNYLDFTGSPRSILNEFKCRYQICIERGQNADIVDLIDSKCYKINSNGNINTFLLCPGDWPIE